MWKLIIFLLGFAVASGVIFVSLFGVENPNQELTDQQPSSQVTVQISDQEQSAKQDKEDSKSFMNRKLSTSKGIVEGLSRENYDLLEKCAQDLMLLSQEANWKVLNTKPYLKMSADFRSSAERLRNAAAEKNLDGATLAYFEVTLICVRCHKYIRTIK